MWPFTRKKKPKNKPEPNKGVRHLDTGRSAFIPSASRDIGSDFLNPLNPLSPISPFNPLNHHSSPECTGDVGSSWVDHTPSYDSSPSCSYDSGSSSSYDSGSFSSSSD